MSFCSVTGPPSPPELLLLSPAPELLLPAAAPLLDEPPDVVPSSVVDPGSVELLPGSVVGVIVLDDSPSVVLPEEEASAEPPSSPHASKRPQRSTGAR